MKDAHELLKETAKNLTELTNIGLFGNATQKAFTAALIAANQKLEQLDKLGYYEVK